jgi:hypothetical protein
VPVRFYLVNPADSVALTVDRLSGAATTVVGAEAEVRVHAITADSSLADTTRVLVGAVPVGVRVDPGYANVAVGGSLQLSGAVVDAFGNPITLFPVTYTSRSPSIATVDGAGLVQAAAAGTAVIYVDAVDFPTFGDSMLVTVPDAGHVVVSTTVQDRAFSSVDAGSEIVMDVTVDMRFTGGELLGSYNAILTWDPAVMQYDTTLAGDFPEPEENISSVGAGELRFAQANAAGMGDVVVVARVRFQTVAAGAAAASLSVTELSAAQTFTNLISLVTVTNGTVTVR